MKNRYRFFKRGSAWTYYVHENATGRQESLHTTDKAEAHKLFNAKNQAANGSSLNYALASAYLAGGSEITERTWAAVMHLAKDRDWLDKSTQAVSDHWKNKNRQKQSKADKGDQIVLAE